LIGASGTHTRADGSVLRRSTAPRRRVATVLFTDIVGSTELAARLGDRGWRTLLERHHAAVRRILRRYRGREIDTAGDGFFALFDEPADAILCAAEITVAVRHLDIQVRAGIHTGEVEIAGDAVSGIGVHIGARLLALAGPSEVIVSSTVRDLVAGSGLEFKDRGRRALKGVPGEWQLYALVPAGAGTEPTADAVPAVTAEEAAAGRAGTRRRGMLGSAAVLAVALAVGAALILIQGTAPGPPASSGLAASLPPSPTAGVASGPNTVVAVGLESGAIKRSIPVGNAPGQLAFGEGALWVVNVSDSTLQRIDPVTGIVAPPIGNIGTPTGIAVGAGRVWVANGIGTHVIWAVDAASVRIISDIQGVGSISGVCFGFGSLWVSDESGDRVLRIDPSSRLTLATIPMAGGTGPQAIAAGAEGIWVVGRNRSVTHIDPATNAVAGVPVTLCDACRPSGVSVGGGLVWVATREVDRVQRIDAASGGVSSVDVGDDPSAILATADGSWVANSLGQSVWHLDTGGHVTQKIGLPGAPMGLAPGDGVIWVSLSQPAR
jgi:class 3 adenylate cyclase/DNA-binding beta-propeller fold protein YncE